MYYSRLFLGTIFAVVTAIATATNSTCKQPIAPPVSGIHHLKFPVSNINVSIDWYAAVMGASRITTLDHINSSGERYAVEMMMPSFGRTVLELRLNPQQASNDMMFDPVTWGVETKADLDAWASWLDAKSVPHSPVFVGVTGWVLAMQVSRLGQVLWFLNWSPSKAWW